MNLGKLTSNSNSSSSLWQDLNLRNNQRKQSKHLLHNVVVRSVLDLLLATSQGATSVGACCVAGTTLNMVDVWSSDGDGCEGEDGDDVGELHFESEEKCVVTKWCK
jgi:hypothetical protein